MALLAAVGAPVTSLLCIEPLEGTTLHQFTPNHSPANGTAALGSEWVVSTQRKEAAIYIWRWGLKAPHAKCRLPEQVRNERTSSLANPFLSNLLFDLPE